MIPRPRVLIVAPTAAVSAALVAWMASTDCVITVVADFESAKRQLDARFNLLITEVKLAAFNGLHLAIRARGHGLAAVVIGAQEPFFQIEARHVGASYVTTPLVREHLLAAVQQRLAGPLRYHGPHLWNGHPDRSRHVP